MANIKREIQNLRRENRRMKVAGLLALAALLVLFACSRGEQKAEAQSKVVDEVRARKLAVVDDRGRERIKLYISDSGSPAIDILDDKGRDRASMYFNAIDGRPQLRIAGVEGKTEALIIGRSRDEGSLSFVTVGYGDNHASMSASSEMSIIELKHGGVNLIEAICRLKDGEAAAGIQLNNSRGKPTIGIQSEGGKGSIFKGD